MENGKNIYIKKITTKSRCFNNKFYAGLMVMALTITFIMLIIYFNIKKEENSQDDFDYDAEYEMYYEYMGDRIREEAKKIYDIKFIKERVNIINKEQKVYLARRHGIFKNSSFIVVIQIHRDTEILLLNALLDCLKNCLGVTNSLLIFSVDFYDDEINELIEGVHFAKYMKIYYPYSTKLYPYDFPGPDTKFCINDFDCEKSMLRYERFAQKKHFWWWQMHFIFDELTILRNYSKTILFIESNQYVLSDFLYIYKVMEAMLSSECPECEIINLGVMHAPELKRFLTHNGNLTVSPWNTHMGSIGIAFNRTVWNSIKNYSSLFCNYNDYRWELSLRHLGLKRGNGQFMVLSSASPRVFTYHRSDGIAECSYEKMTEDATMFLKDTHEHLFPRILKVVKRSDKAYSLEREIGAWEDDRDRGLCMYFVN